MLRPCILLLSLFLITLAAPAQGQEPGQKARGWHSIDQNTPRLFEGILNADLDLETEDGLVISKEDLRDRIYFDAEEQQVATSTAVFASAALGFVAVLGVDLLVAEGYDVLYEFSDYHNKHYWEDSPRSSVTTYAVATVGMGVLGGILSKLSQVMWKEW